MSSSRGMTPTITGHTKVYGVVGDPVSHSLSPVLWNAAFRSLRIDAVYVPFRVRKERLPEALKGLSSVGVQGVNVTLPHKQSASELCDTLLPPAEIIGAVNTVRFETSGVLAGANTDALGMCQLFSDVKIDGPVTLLGAGGAAKAILWSLSQRKATMIYWSNRTAIRLVCPMHFSDSLLQTVPWGSIPLKEAMVGSSLIINATSLGWRSEDTLPQLANVLGPQKTYIDLNYNPASRLLAAARASGAKVIDGIELLILQGAASFNFLTHLEPPLNAMRKSMKFLLLEERISG